MSATLSPCWEILVPSPRAAHHTTLYLHPSALFSVILYPYLLLPRVLTPFALPYHFHRVLLFSLSFYRDGPGIFTASGTQVRPFPDLLHDPFHALFSFTIPLSFASDFSSYPHSRCLGMRLIQPSLLGPRLSHPCHALEPAETYLRSDTASTPLFGFQVFSSQPLDLVVRLRHPYNPSLPFFFTRRL